MDKNKTDEKEIRKAYRGQRQWLGLAQMALAKSAGLSSDKLARWEKGRAKFNEEEITRLGRALDAATIVRAESIKGPLKSGTGESVKSWRLAYGITQEELGRRVGTTQASISLFENGYDVLDAEEANEIYVACHELILEKESSRPAGMKCGVPLGPALSGRPVQRQESTEERLQKEVVLLNKMLANSKEMEALSKKIYANQEEIIEELKTEIARLELLNKEIGESKDREIQALREQLEAKKRSVTVPPEDILGTDE